MDANEEGFAAGVGECASGTNGEVTRSTELLPVGPQSDPADEDGEGAFAAVVEEEVVVVVVVVFRSRWVFVFHLSWEEPFVEIFFLLFFC